MSWLNAILAFSLAMIVFCTIVSALTEVVHEVAKRREKGLQWMLTRLYTEVLEPYARKVSGAVVDVDKELNDDFLKRVALNRSTKGNRDIVLSRLAFDDFIERLAETNVGQRLFRALAATAQGHLRERAEPMLADLGRAFARFESDATAHFASWARWYTVMVSLLVAFALNVDAVRLFSAFVADRDLAQAMVTHADAITAGLQEGKSSDNARAETLESTVADLRQQVRSTVAMGLPIGIRYFPWCQGDGDVDPACEARGPWARLLVSLRWFFSVTLAGVLIGLGGPFWFDVYSKLSRFMQSTRRRDGASPADEPETTTSSAGAKYPDAAKLAPLFIAAAEFAAAVRAGHVETQ